MDPGGSNKRCRVILAACGCVPAVKFGKLCLGFSEWADVITVITKNALPFTDRNVIPNNMPIYTDEDDWACWTKPGDNILHIELQRWADILVIAPLSAHTLAKITAGLCDNLLTCIVRAWDCSKPIFIAPSMNSFMWKNRITKKHLLIAEEMGITLIPPFHNMFGGQETLNGAMAETSEINLTVRLFKLKQM